MENKKSFPWHIFLLITLCIIAVVLFLYASKKMKENNNSYNGDVWPSQSITDDITYEGNTYTYNKNLLNILFLGVDKTEIVELQSTPGTAGQSDCIIILSINRETQETKMIQISRDSMTEVEIYDANGNYFTTVIAQIATQYAYGNGKDTSCWATKRAVSKLLGDLPIAGYVSINIDGIQTLTDAIGGVTINIPEDYTHIDPLFIKGETITLTGKQAERYVRYRDLYASGSNSDRMRRQTQFIPALIDTVKSKVGSLGDLYESFYQLLSPYMVTDLTADQIDELADYNLQTDEFLYVPGEIRAGEKYEEYHVDKEELQKLLLDTFYLIKE